MKKYLTYSIILILGLLLFACSDHEEDFPSNNMKVILYHSHDTSDSFFANKIYFVSFVLNNGAANPVPFTRDNLKSAIDDFSNGKKDKVFVDPEKEYGIYSLIPEEEQIPMSQGEFDALPENSPFRLLKYNEKSPYIIQPNRRYSSVIPLQYANKIKMLIDDSLVDKNSDYDFCMEFIPLGISITLKEAKQTSPKVIELDIL